jgi:hypothetical protein
MLPGSDQGLLEGVDGATNAPRKIFFLVGGLLLALLFALDAFLPKVPVVEQAKANSPLIRIYSDRKWPERIVYDTNAPTIVPTSIASTEVTLRTPEMIADASADATEREAFAMLLPSSVDQSQPSHAGMREPKMRQQRKITRKRAPAHRVAMARHLQFGWFGRNFW